MKKRFWLFLIILLVFVLLISAGMIVKKRIDENRQDTAIDRQSVQKDENELVDFSLLKSKNEEIIAWLTLDGTAIDYPVVQGSDNTFYLKFDANKNMNRNGALFLDYHNAPDFSDPNNIIYGHNMRSGRMFNNLVKFTDKDFFDTHQTGRLYTPERIYRLEIFAVCVTESIGNPYTLSFVTKDDFSGFIEQIKQDAKNRRDVDVQYGDRILTLSTCSYEFGNARTVIHAKLYEN